MYSEETHGLLTLHYGKHHATIVDEIKTCFDSENYADMTFICDDKTTLNAHRLIMASASPLVRRILVDSAHVNAPAIIHIPGIKSTHMKHLLDFLYHGQACIKVRNARGKNFKSFKNPLCSQTNWTASKSFSSCSRSSRICGTRN